MPPHGGGKCDFALSIAFGAPVHELDLMLKRLNLSRLQPRAASKIPVPVRLVLGLALLVFSGTILLIVTEYVSDRPVTWNEAMFTTVSALTVTGLSVISPGRDLTLEGQIVLLILIQLGGTGFMAFAVVFFQLLGWQVRLDNRIALRDALGLNNVGDILRLMRRALIVLFTIELTGALLLFLHWRNFLPLPEWQIAWYALFHAVSAMCNAGFDLFGGLPQFPQGVPLDDLSLTILSTLIFLGGIGIPVISNVLRYPIERKLQFHVKIALITSLILIVMGGLLIMAAESRPNGVLANEPSWWRRLMMSMATSVSTRTAGFAFLPDFNNISAATRFIIMTLMFIGASPASMGGGIKTVTFAVLVLGVISYARSMPDITVWRRTISKANVQKAAAVLIAALFVVVTSSWLLMMTHEVVLDVALFEVISAFATCGLSVGMTSQLSLFGQMLIMFVMFWGRLGALSIVSAIALPRKRTPVRFPEDEVFIG
jgi:trk system potassium uptake protein